MLLATIATAFWLAAPAQAAVPPVHARAYLVEDARTGEVLAASNADERLPIASITKLMTVLLTLEHHKLIHARQPSANPRSTCAPTSGSPSPTS
jgi:D-alanyl-D-alanine carboxypeptidase